MTFAGKKFKDIYDSGVKSLSEIELEASEKMNNLKKEHSAKYKDSTERSLKQIEEQSDLLKIELKQSIETSLKKVQAALISENIRSQEFTSSLTLELNTLTEQMKSKLRALKQSHSENVDFARTVACENYLSTIEELRFDIEQTVSRVIQNLALKGNAALTGLQQELAKVLTEARSGASELIQSCLDSSQRQANAIDEHSAGLLQTLSVDCQSKLKVLENSARRANQEVESSARSLLEAITNHAATLEKEIGKDYDQISTSHFQNADDRLSVFADELSALHDTTTEQLIRLTDELSNDLLSKSTQVQDGLHGRCDTVVGQVTDLFSGFEGRLNDRLKLSRGQKQTLEIDKNKILAAVQNELISIQNTFAKKISYMLNESKSELAKITGAVETQIVSTVDNFGQQMDNSATFIQKQIEEEVSKFSLTLSVARSVAVEEISAAALGKMPSLETVSDDTQPVDITESQPVDIVKQEESEVAENKPRRNRRRKDVQE